MVPEYLVKACREMGLDFNLVDFNYRVIDVTTILINLQGSPFFTILFKEGIDRIQLPIPILNYNYFKVILDDDDESITLLSDKNILTMPQ